MSLTDRHISGQMIAQSGDKLLHGGFKVAASVLRSERRGRGIDRLEVNSMAIGPTWHFPESGYNPPKPIQTTQARVL